MPVTWKADSSVEKGEFKVIFVCTGCARKVQHFETERFNVYCSKCGKEMRKGYVA